MPCFFASSCISLIVGPSGIRSIMLVPARLLLGAEVRAVEELLQAEDLDAAPRRLVDERQVLVDHRLLDVVGRALERHVGLDLNQSAAHDPAHGTLLSEPVTPTLAASEGGLLRRSSRCERRRSPAGQYFRAEGVSRNV